MKTSHLALACLVGTCLAYAAVCVAEDAESSHKEMLKKLEFSKNILAGLTTQDFDSITKNAQALNELGKKRWMENPSSGYRTQHQVFWFANEALLDAAKEENVDAATLAYTQMTFGCVNCHKELRKL